MRDVPKDLSIKTVALWLRDSLPGRVWPTDEIDIDFIVQAEAVLALVREKVREALVLTDHFTPLDYPPLAEKSIDAIVARVMGDHPSNASGGHGEPSGRDEAPRG